MTPETILAAMTALIPPGISPYSAVPEKPGITCDTAYTKGCRKETEAEGLERYQVIAQAIAEVSGGSIAIAAQILSAVLFESGARRDVHSGQGKFARGDNKCSWGLGQANICGGTTRRGWKGEDLTGLDLDSTRRSIVTVKDGLARANGYCRMQAGDASFACTMSVYGSGKISMRSHPAILRRVRSYGRITMLLSKGNES